MEDGITAANRLCAIDPKHESTYRLDLADVYERRGELHQAMELYAEVLAKYPRDAWPTRRWARFLVAPLGEKERAKAVYGQLVQTAGMGDREGLDEAKRELGALDE